MYGATNDASTPNEANGLNECSLNGKVIRYAKSIGRDAIIDTVTESIMKAKNLGPSGAGAKFRACPKFTALEVPEFNLVAVAVEVGFIVARTLLFESGA
jgi:hypothetical protein